MVEVQTDFQHTTYIGLFEGKFAVVSGCAFFYVMEAEPMRVASYFTCERGVISHHIVVAVVLVESHDAVSHFGAGEEIEIAKLSTQHNRN